MWSNSQQASGLCGLPQSSPRFGLVLQELGHSSWYTNICCTSLKAKRCLIRRIGTFRGVLVHAVVVSLRSRATIDQNVSFPQVAARAYTSPPRSTVGPTDSPPSVCRSGHWWRGGESRCLSSTQQFKLGYLQTLQHLGRWPRFFFKLVFHTSILLEFIRLVLVICLGWCGQGFSSCVCSSEIWCHALNMDSRIQRQRLPLEGTSPLGYVHEAFSTAITISGLLRQGSGDSGASAARSSGNGGRSVVQGAQCLWCFALRVNFYNRFGCFFTLLRQVMSLIHKFIILFS